MFILILQLISSLLLAYGAIVVIYLLFFAVAGRFRRSNRIIETSSAITRRMVVLIPAYKEDAVILETARQSLGQTYPASCYDIVVIADSLRAETVWQLQTMPIQVMEVQFEKSSKAKALNMALAELPGSYDVAVVLDADNIMAPDFLERVNGAVAGGARIIQGHRVAKNTDSAVAVLDAISEEINNHIFRQGHGAVGLSAALIGSGTAFEYGLLRTIMPDIKALGGFDKELEMRLLQQRFKFVYLPDALVYDEKVPDEAIFERQRTRWIAAQYKYFRLNAVGGLRALLTGNIDYADKVFQTMMLPRVLLLGGLLLGLLIGLLTQSHVFAGLVGAELLLLLVAFYLATPAGLLRRVGPTELLKLPVLFAHFLRSIYRMRTARTQFLHTPHTAK